MGYEPLTAADLLRAWREATEAAELAERLTIAAVKAADEADARIDAAGEIAHLARQTAEHAAAAAAAAATLAHSLREVERLRSAAADAGARYRRAEAKEYDTKRRSMDPPARSPPGGSD
jgi:hypothetical protein